jgi:hypothetical protein
VAGEAREAHRACCDVAAARRAWYLRGARVGGVDGSKATENGIPVGDRDDAVVGRAARRRWEEAAAHEGVGAHAALEVVVLAASEREVVGGSRLVQGAAIVGDEGAERGLPHALRLEAADELADGLIHVQDHRGVETAVGRVEGRCVLRGDDGVDSVEVGLRHL